MTRGEGCRQYWMKRGIEKGRGKALGMRVWGLRGDLEDALGWLFFLPKGQALKRKRGSKICRG